MAANKKDQCRIKHLVNILSNILSNSNRARTGKDVDKLMNHAVGVIDSCMRAISSSNRSTIYSASHNSMLKYGIDFGFDDMPRNSNSWRNRDWIQGECGSTNDMKGLTKKILRKWLGKTIERLN